MSDKSVFFEQPRWIFVLRHHPISLIRSAAFLKGCNYLISNQSAAGPPASSGLMADMTGLDLALLIPPFCTTPPLDAPPPGAIDHHHDPVSTARHPGKYPAWQWEWRCVCLCATNLFAGFVGHFWKRRSAAKSALGRWISKGCVCSEGTRDCGTISRKMRFDIGRRGTAISVRL